MTVLIKIGIVLSSGAVFFFSFIYLAGYLSARRKKAEEEKKRLTVITDEEYEKEKPERTVLDEPGLEKLSEKRRNKYLRFKAVFPRFNLRTYTLLKTGLSAALMLGLGLTVNFVFGFAGFMAGMIIPDAVAGSMVKKGIERFELQLVDGLTLVANALKAGASFSQAVEVMISETKPPLSTQFGIFLKENRMGASVEEALANLSGRVDSEELKIVVVSISIARQAGGNLSEILLHTADTIRERERIKGKIDAITAQGKMSGIVIGSLPVGLSLILYMIDPVMMAPLFLTFAGQLVLMAVGLFVFVGFIWIRKIIAIDI